MCAYDNVFVNCTLSWLPSFLILCVFAEQVSLCRCGSLRSCIDGNVVNNLAVFWILLLSTKFALFSQNVLEVCRKFITTCHCISCTDKGSNSTLSIYLIRIDDDCSYYIICCPRCASVFLSCGLLFYKFTFKCVNNNMVVLLMVE